MTAADRWIDKHLSRLQWGLFLQHAAEWIAGYLLILGCAVLVVKLAFYWMWPHALWLALGIIPMAFIGWWLANRTKYERKQSVAMLDSRLNAGGLLMSLSEIPDEQWAEQLPKYENMWSNSLPKIRPKRFGKMLAAPLAFAIAACFMPLHVPAETPLLDKKVGQEATSELETLLKSLDEAQVLKEEDKEEIQNELEKLAEETKKNPLTHEKWETLDALQQKLQLRLDQAQQRLQKGAAAADALMKAIEAGEELSADEMAELEKSLEEGLQQLSNSGQKGGSSQQMSQKLSQALKQLQNKGELKLPNDAQLRQELLNELKEHLKKECQNCAQLQSQCQGGLCEGGQCQGNGFNDNGGESESERGGRGGTSRGKGDAEMSWGDESDENGSKFKEVILPPGYLDQQKEELTGMTRRAPEVKPADSAPRNTARQTDPSAGRETWNRTLRPKHRKVVRDFFQSPTGEKGTSTPNE